MLSNIIYICKYYNPIYNYFMVQNVYIHIPFCRQKCKYCSFVSFPNIEKKSKYLDALRQEILLCYKNEQLKTLYIGGGTPSVLDVKEIDCILRLFNTEPNAEITIEINPETVDYEYLCALQKIGVNRISIGCQTFDDKILLEIGRIHNSHQVIKTVKNAQNAGFKNISLDLIYGLPNQTIQRFENDLNQAINLEIQHISLYGLKIEEGCAFYYNIPNNLPDEDSQADMYLKALSLMDKYGFEHYEISNFAQKNFYSRHNLNYWDNNSYYGFGVAAHGYTNGVRYSNTSDIDKYIENPIVNKGKKVLSLKEQQEEEIFLGFRKMSGIDTNLFYKKFGINFDVKYKSVLDKYLKTGHIMKTPTGYKFTTDGIMVSNYILADFLE